MEQRKSYIRAENRIIWNVC